MSQADSPNTTSPSRRTVLAGISVAVVPVAAAVDKSLGGVALTDDPIFALIQAHQADMLAMVHACESSEKFDLSIPDRWLPQVLTTQPTTMAGVAALLAHVGQPENLVENLDEETRESVLSGVSEARPDLRAAGREFPARLAVTVRVLAGLPPAAMSAPASAAPSPDPIFALIEAYDRAASQEMASYGERDGLEETLPKEQRTWSIHFGGGGDGRWPPEGCTDAPKWINAQLAIGIASEKISDQMLALLTTAPRTIEGVIALLERLDAATFPEERDHPGAESLITTMGEWYDGRVADAADAFHSTLAEALRKIIAA
jgi:hypothetical protein